MQMFTEKNLLHSGFSTADFQMSRDKLCHHQMSNFLGLYSFQNYGNCN